MNDSHDVLIVGGGIIGLSLAAELAAAGQSVHLVDAREPGRESSWAGVGIFPPPPANPATPYEQLLKLSIDLHAAWAKMLLAETGIDNEFYRCGALFVARTDDTLAELKSSLAEWRKQEVRCEALTQDKIMELEPHIQLTGSVQEAYLLPDKYQFRNPRHLKGLIALCQKRGVTITPHAAVESFVTEKGRVVAARTAKGEFRAKNFVLAAGAWSRLIGETLGLNLPIKPMRGQIVLLRPDKPLLNYIYYENPRYLIPRRDGRVFVGSTVEDAGFDHRTTSGIVEWLLTFAHSVVPELRSADVEMVYSGLRPGNGDGFPYMGRSGRWENLFVSAGHFRAGLQLSPAAAVVMSQLISGKQPEIDLTPFSVDR